jgi:hypothetical protein
VVAAPARQEWPDTAAFADPEVIYRLNKRQRIGLVVAADTPQRVEELLADYVARITRDHLPVPPTTKAPA